MRSVLTVFLAAVAIFQARPMYAEPETLRLKVISEPLREVVDTLSYMSGLPVSVVGTLDGRVEGWTLEAAGGLDAFARLGADYRLFVAYDGSRIIVAARDNLSTRLFDGHMMNWNSAQSLVRALYPVLPEDALQKDKASGMIVLRGPDTVVKAIAEVLSRPDDRDIQVIRSGHVQVVKPGSQS
ncbi:hypothetical protein [Rhizobium paknamense]|uniref:Uncharacterized protein n=1 Tax=Rhizobium paknamense TaxID=1206817 RepID=A0ABU0IFC0_9HYPH|nr:hypothetical protein [Rhizobium paknamense]MDQ0456397.1 hypothetical protein [Rhizobium paknamense]